MSSRTRFKPCRRCSRRGRAGRRRRPRPADRRRHRRAGQRGAAPAGRPAALRAHRRCWRASPSRDGLRGVRVRCWCRRTIPPAVAAGAGRHRRRAVRAAAPVLRPRARAVDAAAGAAAGAGALAARAAACRRWRWCCRTRQGRLPEALKRGLASLDEQAVAALGFERVLLVRSAQKPAARRGAACAASGWRPGCCRSHASWCPAASSRCAPPRWPNCVDAALRIAPPGIHVAAPELVWRAAQGDCARWRGAGARGLTRRIRKAASARIRSELHCPCARPKLQAASLDGTADDVEAAFYDALQTRRHRQAHGLLGRRGRDRLRPPGRPAAGRRRRAIRATFEAMFANGSIRAWPSTVRKVESHRAAACTTCWSASRC